MKAMKKHKQNLLMIEKGTDGIDVEYHPGIKSSDALGRVYTVHPSNAECFFLRMLLHLVRGLTSCTVDSHVCAAFSEACQMGGLLENSSEP